MTAEIINLGAYRSAKPPASPDEVPLGQAISICLDHPEVLTPWEAHFLLSIRQSHCRLSPKQQAIMQRLFDKAWAAAERDDASWPEIFQNWPQFSRPEGRISTPFPQPLVFPVHV